MSKLTILLIIIFLILLSLLASFNKATIDLTIWAGVSYPVPVVALILGSVAIGILFMSITVVFRDAKRYLHHWQLQRKHKREARIQEYYTKGLEEFHASNLDTAVELFTRVIEEEPSHMDAYLRLGDISLIREEYSRATDHYLKAKELKPKSIEALLSLERVADSQKKWREAINYLDTVLEIDDENTQILYKKRDIYERNRNWEELMEVQVKILRCNLSPEEEQKENEKLLGYKYELGCHYLQMGHADKAVKTLKNVIKTNRDFEAAYLALAEVYLKEKNNKEAKDILMKGYEATSSMVFLAKLEELYISTGEPGTIIDVYQKAIQKNQKDMRLQFYLAKLYYRLEMIDYALDTINNIDTTAFDHPELHALLGSVYDRRSEFKKAADEFKKALNIDALLVAQYCCSHCHYTSMDWAGRCPDCKRWNTFILDIDEVCETLQRQSSS